MRVDLEPVLDALGEWHTVAVINRFLGTQLLPPDLASWSYDDRAMVVALAIADLEQNARQKAR